MHTMALWILGEKPPGGGGARLRSQRDYASSRCVVMPRVVAEALGSPLAHGAEMRPPATHLG